VTVIQLSHPDLIVLRCGLSHLVEIAGDRDPEAAFARLGLTLRDSGPVLLPRRSRQPWGAAPGSLKDPQDQPTIVYGHGDHPSHSSRPGDASATGVRRLSFRRGDAPGRYQAFEEKFIGLVRGYWRTNATASLDSALRVLVRLDATASRHTAAQQQVTSFEGWLGTEGGFAIHTRRLRKLNPGYRVAFEKRPRPDVDEELGSTGLAVGFAVRAFGSLKPATIHVWRHRSSRQLLPLEGIQSGR